MRPLEALLAGLLTLSAVSLFVEPARRYRWVVLLPAAAIFVTVMQLLLEGYRWQIVPLYCIAVLSVVAMVRNLRLVKAGEGPSIPRRAKWLRALGAVFSLFALGLAVAPAILFPTSETTEAVRPVCRGHNESALPGRESRGDVYPRHR